DVVHGRDPRFREYEYDPVWQQVKVYVMGATRKRKTLAIHSLYQRLLVYLREQLVILTAKAEEIEGEPETVPEENPLYKAAIARLGTDASPRDLARDGVGCAESVSTIIRSILPTFRI